MKNSYNKYTNVVANPNNESCGNCHDHSYEFCDQKIKHAKPHVVSTQEVHVMRKDLFGSKVIDAILNSVERSIAFSPDYIEKTEDLNPVMQLFDEVMYDPYGYKRLISFNQFGSFYIAKVFDKDKFIFVAYSIYDIFDYYNSDSSKEIPYVKIYETLTDTNYTVTSVDNPIRYERNALDESWKYKISFENSDVVDLFVNPSEICVSKVYTKVEPIEVSNMVTGFVQFVINHKVFEFHYAIDKKRITNTEYKDVWAKVQRKYKDELRALAPYGLSGWILKDTEETIGVDDLHLVPTINGPIVFEGIVIEEDPDASEDVDGDGENDYDDWVSSDDSIIGPDDYEDDDSIKDVFDKDEENENNCPCHENDCPCYEDDEDDPKVDYEDEETWENQFIDIVKVGEDDYGVSFDGKNQNLNQDKVAISTEVKDGLKYVILTCDLNELDSWISTNANQQDSPHKWFALDFIIYKDKIEKERILWNNNELYSSDTEFDYIVTYWAKLDVLKDEEKTIVISDKDNVLEPEQIIVKVVDISK